jgi:PAS domain S-box-containing protein
MRASNFVYLFFFITIVFSNPFSITADAKESQRVLILRFDNSFAPGPSKTQTQLVKTLQEKSSPKILIDVEYLDLSRYNDEQHQKNLIDLLEHKYSTVKFDLIITIGSLALEMVLAHDADLFRRSPVVFCLFQPNLPETYKKNPDTTGLIAKGHHNSIQKTLELSLELQPKVENVIVIAGVDKWSRNLLKIAKEISRPYEKQYRFSWLTDKTMDELIETVSTPMEKTIILYLSVIKDTAGNKYIPVHACRMIAQAAKAPVYALWSGTIGAGAIGGYVLSGEKIGEQTADMCLKILNGEKPSNIPIERYEDAYMFDWRQVKRWSIPEDRLPPGSIVKFKEFTVWDRYKGRIISAFALILFQALIISYLVYQRRIRRQAEEELLRAEQKHRTVADYTYDWEYWQNSDSSLQYVSPSCERISGYTAQDFMKNPSLLLDIIVPEDKKAWDEHRCNIPKEMKSQEIQFRIQRPDGEIRWIEHACQPVFDRQGNNQGVRASNRDITEREFYRSETHQLQSELAHMDRIVTVSALTSALAHEINQPLAAMRSYAQAALRFMDKDKPEYDSVRKALHGIVDDNKRAAAVINQLRNLVKKETATWETLDINSIINDVISLINSEIVLRNASIRLDLHPIVPVVYGNSIQIQQVLINLLTNALDALDDQPVEARTITIFTRPENSNEIIISISDSGEGIPPDTIEAIFSPFHTTKSTGIGLGLSICKTIIEAHGGKIWADNNPEGGAIFSLILLTGSQSK